MKLLLGFGLPPLVCGGPPRLGGGGGAMRGMVLVGMWLGGFGLGDRGDDTMFFLPTGKLDPDPDEVRPREGGGGGGPLLPERLCMDDVELELDIFRPPGRESAGGVARSLGGPGREGPDEGLPPLKDEVLPREGGGGGTFPRVGGGGPVRVGGAGGVDLFPPGVGREDGGAPGRLKPACLTVGMGLGPFVEGGEVGLLNLPTGGGRLPPPPTGGGRLPPPGGRLAPPGCLNPNSAK